jgi:hypothetical protein
MQCQNTIASIYPSTPIKRQGQRKPSRNSCPLICLGRVELASLVLPRGVEKLESFFCPIAKTESKHIVPVLLRPIHDYYRISSGSEFDQLVQEKLLSSNSSEPIPQYSVDERYAKRALRKLKSTVEPTLQ